MSFLEKVKVAEPKKGICKCKESNGVNAVQDMWGYWLHCNVCGNRIEDSYTYHSDDMDLY